MTQQTTSMPDEFASAPEPPSRTARSAMFVVRHRHLVAILALVVTLMTGWVGYDVDSRLSAEGMLPPRAESLRVNDMLAADFAADDPDVVVLAGTRGDRTGVDDPQAVAAGRAVEGRLAASRGVVRVRSYWSAPTPQEAASLRTPTDTVP